MRCFEMPGTGVRRTLMYLGLVATLSTGANALADVEKGSQNGIAFENGGWSGETADAIKGSAGNFPVMLVFAWNEGTYLADVNVRVVNAKGATVLSLRNLGPLVLIDLPKGAYSISAERNGNSQSRRINVGANTRIKAVFHWPKDASDRGLEVGMADTQERSPNVR